MLTYNNTSNKEVQGVHILNTDTVNNRDAQT